MTNSFNPKFARHLRTRSRIYVGSLCGLGDPLRLVALDGIEKRPKRRLSIRKRLYILTGGKITLIWEHDG